MSEGDDDRRTTATQRAKTPGATPAPAPAAGGLVPLFRCRATLGMTVVAAVVVSGVLVVAIASVVAAVLAAERIARGQSETGTWLTVALGAGIALFATGAALSLVANVVPRRCVLDPATGSLVIERHPFRDLRIPVRDVRAIGVRGHLHPGGRLQLVVEFLGPRRRRWLAWTDSGRSMPTILGRQMPTVERLARRLDVPVERSGWAADPGRDPHVTRRAPTPPVGWD